jgi:hypothetical protein
VDVHDRSLDQLRDVLSPDLRRELDGILLPLRNGPVAPSESEIRIAQAQLVGWLQGLFHGIQASLASQQAAAQRQLLEMRDHTGAADPDAGDEYPGSYL